MQFFSFKCTQHTNFLFALPGGFFQCQIRKVLQGSHEEIKPPKEALPGSKCFLNVMTYDIIGTVSAIWKEGGRGVA